MYCRCFFASVLNFPNDVEVFFIKYDASGVPHFQPFTKTIIDALKVSFISVLLLLVLISLIVLPSRSNYALVTGVTYAFLAMEVIAGSSTWLVQEPFSSIDVGL